MSGKKRAKRRIRKKGKSRKLSAIVAVDLCCPQWTMQKIVKVPIMGQFFTTDRNGTIHLTEKRGTYRKTVKAGIAAARDMLAEDRPDIKIASARIIDFCRST